jgi:hypothetical protein
MKDISMNEYQKFIEYLKKNYNKNLDKLAVNLTNPVLNDEITSQQLYDLIHELYSEYKSGFLI